MPRGVPAARNAGATIKDESLPGLDGLQADPKPGEKPRRGRPRGSKSAPKIIGRSSTGKVMSRAQMVSQVATELYAFASAMVGLWSFRDPECAESFTDTVMTSSGERERLEAICEQFANIIGRNDHLLATMAKGGIIVDVGVMMSLLSGPIKTIIKAHGPGGYGHELAEGQPDHDYSKYEAPSLA